MRALTLQIWLLGEPSSPRSPVSIGNCEIFSLFRDGTETNAKEQQAKWGTRLLKIGNDIYLLLQ